MAPEALYIIFPLIALAAFYIKGITGIGNTTIIVACSSFFIDPKIAIVMASFINIFSNISMIRIDPVPIPKNYWIPIALMLSAGSVAGAYALKYIDPELFSFILSIAFFLTSLWFLLRKSTKSLNLQPPLKASPLDQATALFAGFCAGFIGIHAPPLILRFGHYLAKRPLRRLMVLIFLPAAVIQTAAFAANGLLTGEIVLYGLSMLPTMALGIWLGNQVFHKISELWFRRILGIFLVIVSLKLAFNL